jgi:hypothetical protein
MTRRPSAERAAAQDAIARDAEPRNRGN